MDTTGNRVAILCNLCITPTNADFYIVEPIGIVNYGRPVCATCGALHIGRVAGASLVPIDSELTDIELYNLCLQAVEVTVTETVNGSPQAAQVRVKAKHELRKRLQLCQ